MSFISMEYIMLLIAGVILYYVMPHRIRWMIILCINVLFYGCAGIHGLIIVFCNILLVYAAGIILERTTEYKKIICLVYIILQLSLLFVFKYQLFLDITAPLAISFYTLTSIGYVIDVYRGKYKSQKNPFKLAAFISFFPIMVQGPICRYDEMEKSIFHKKTFDFTGFTYGITRIVYGFFKKLVIAERLSIVFDGLNAVNENGAAIALNILVYAFYLYSDFSGGIDIAVGTGYLFGIKLPENFNSPFFSVSINDYWRRWHMSLGAWFRDYLFYPVSFSKPVVKLGKKIRTHFGNSSAKKVPIYISTLAVWFATGLWHGTNLNFILWGLLNAVVILISYELDSYYKRFGEKYHWTKSKMYGCFRVIRTFILMGILRMLDYNTVAGYAESLCRIVTDFSVTQLTEGKILTEIMAVSDYIVVFIGILIMFMVALVKKNADYRKAIWQKGVLCAYGIIALLIMVIIVFGMYGIGYEGKEFIYIRY